jgi:UDP-N-acetylmuramate--alanine ligase
MNLNQIHNVYFIGIGGIGMSALARYFKNIGKEVAGYDKTSTALTRELIDKVLQFTLMIVLI